MNPKIRQKLELFFQKYRLIKYKRNELIARPGDHFQNISFVKSGYVRLYTISANGEELTINVFKPIFYLSLIYAMDNLENKYYFEAVTPIEVWQAPKDEVLNFIKNDSEIHLELTRNILHYSRDLLTNIECLISGDAYTKVASLLLSFANNYGECEGKSIVIKLRTTHRIIASLTGMARETASIQMAKLEEKGLISSQGRLLIIKNINRLQEEIV